MSNGALAAKLTGGGKGGHILALVEKHSAERLLNALSQASKGRAFVSSLLPKQVPL
jgi:mevalonate kinase